MKTSFAFNALILSILLSSCGEVVNEENELIKPVKYAQIGNTQSGGIKTFNGTSKSGSETKLSFRANGLIVSLDVKNGDKVKKGQLLAKLDQKDISLAYDKTKATVASAESQMQTSKANLDRVKELYQSGGASLNDYEQAKNAYTNANANYDAALKSLSIQSSQFSYTKIIAPTDGIVTSVNAEVNEFAQAGSPIFIMNSDGNDLVVEIGLPEAYISKVKHGEEVDVKINKKKLKGTVTEVAFSTGNTMTYRVIVELIDITDDLRPDMPAEVTFDFSAPEGEQTNQLIIPVKGVGNDIDGNFAYVLEDTESSGIYIVHKRILKLGELSDEGYQVIDGLNAGEIIAIAGLRSLYEGMKVTLLK